ncbi:MAG: histidine kinase N-terminal 7TM domain-containing protein [Chloroflexota bacterium]
MISTIRLTLMVITICIAALSLLIAYRRRTVPGSASLICFSAALAILALAYSLFLYNLPQFATLWLSITYLGMAGVAISLFTFVLEYTHRQNWIRPRNLALVAAIPLVTQILIWTNPRHEFIFSEQMVPGWLGITPQAGPWLWINAIYNNLLVLIAIYFLARVYFEQAGLFRVQVGLVLVGLSVPGLTGTVAVSALVAHPNPDVYIFSFTVTAIILLYAFFRGFLLEIVPISRAMVIESIRDGWVVLDNKNRIVDLNAAAESLIGLTRAKVFGRPAEEILRNWENVTRNPSLKEQEFRGSVNLKDEWRYLNIRLSPFADKQGNNCGRVIVWRDITERRHADEARQRARDEMFVLLHALSGVASRAMQLKDFFSETVYQIVYSFHSQYCIIYLFEQDRGKDIGQRFRLVAQHGLRPACLDEVSTFLSETDILESFMFNQEVLLVPDATLDSRIPASIHKGEPISIVVAPMSIEKRVLGIIALARGPGQQFNDDEAVKLTVVADEIAGYIHSDRQRQMTITSAERQRLARDLHDSVSQRLYGLLALTEAAQAGLETGSLEKPSKVFSRIGEHARQAIKEMRLFLYELQPVDLENEGLVAVLHQRLAAVEGRADVKTKFIADEELSISLEKQIALYFIAQEALNNILRHAVAKSVTIRLKQTRVNVTLSIRDDGLGFDPKKESKGGMGLKNMKERTAQVGGKFRIQSAVGEGTRIQVAVKRDNYSKRQKKEPRE